MKQKQQRKKSRTKEALCYDQAVRRWAAYNSLLYIFV